MRERGPRPTAQKIPRHLFSTADADREAALGSLDSGQRTGDPLASQSDHGTIIDLVDHLSGGRPR